jgi:hypothetical protein
MGWLKATEEKASEKTMQTLMTFKDSGFVNVRGERRGYISNQGVLPQRIKLFDGQEYLAVVGGDEDVETLNLVIKDLKGNEILRSTGKGLTSIQFTPPTKDKYNFIIETPEKGGYYHFSLVTK